MPANMIQHLMLNFEMAYRRLKNSKKLCANRPTNSLIDIAAKCHSIATKRQRAPVMRLLEDKEGRIGPNNTIQLNFALRDFTGLLKKNFMD